jgi:FtsZ-binding cell division protein ZapB
MLINTSFKNKLHQAVLQNLQMEVEELDRQLKLLQESDDGEEKSSAGDKYETQREMNQQSRSLLQNRLQIAISRIQYLHGIAIKNQEKVEPHALIQLNTGIFWITFGLGKIDVDGQSVHLISMDSPLYLELKDKKTSETFLFRGQKISILEVV